MRKIPVLNEKNIPIGYLLLDNQMFYPYTIENHPLPKVFFVKQHAEEYLRSISHVRPIKITSEDTK
jgi:hypothetical protein